MEQIFNATQEMEYSRTYTDIRFTRVPLEEANDPDDALDINLMHDWTDPSDEYNLSKMSAVCFLYARHIYDKLQIPLGLIDSAYGGTPVESWSSLEMLDVCGLAKDEPRENDLGSEGPTCNGFLYNKMIYPLRK